MRISVFRKEHFNAAHRLDNPTWDEAKNKAVFGLCNNANYHGHNYTLIVKLTGEVNPDTGYLMDLKDLKEVIRRCVLEKFDHRNLNLDVVEFKNLNPTAEHIAFVIWTILRKEIELNLELSVKLYETERNFVEYNGK
jgi:6-pyruvoyltetrahydropterin/6-carboxytetrahydropterin synthase